MSFFTQRGATEPIGFNSTSTDQSLATLVGSVAETSDGREFVLVQNAGTALSSGKLVMGPKPIANHQNLVTTTTQAVGDTSITVTLGGTLVTANQYQGGFLIVNAGTGIGQTLKIKGHLAQSSATGNVVINLEDPIVVATSSVDTKVCLRLNPFGSSNGTDVRTSGVIITDHTAPTGRILGVPTYPIAASTSTVPTFGWVQKSGLCGVLNDAGTVVGASGGLDVMPSSNTDGAVMTYVVATGSRLGTSTQTGVTTEVREVTLQL